MTHTYKIKGMTCSGCQAKVQSLLTKVPGVRHVEIDLAKGEAVIDMEKHVPTVLLQAALSEYPKYDLADVHHPGSTKVTTTNSAEVQVSWVSTYKPILLIFAYIVGVSLLVEWVHGNFALSRWMAHFMGGFFLTFSFFKMLNLKGFAESYAMYDILAKQWAGWGYIYAFLELGLGLAFLAGYNPILTNSVTLIIMSISIIGVAQSVLNKRKIKCACLGDVFNLPMSTITLIEDGLMIAMSALMIAMMV